MSNRAGRRRRHKRHKERMLRHPVRTWPWRRLGLEFQAMQEFAASSVQRGAYIDLDGGLAFTDAPYVQLARWDAPQFLSMQGMSLMTNPAVRITTYRLKRWCEGRSFYEGRNLRRRELPATLEATDGK